MKIERDQLERLALEFAVIANSHNEIQAVDRDAFPFAFLRFFAEPLARNFRPDFFANERSFLITNPAGFARKNENGIAGERDKHVDVTVNNFETGGVPHGAFESGILIAANDQGIDLLGFHRGADIFVAAFDFCLAGHWRMTSG